MLTPLFSFFIDKFFGEFKAIKHPIIFIGDYITFFEKRFFKDSKLRGVFLLATTLLLVWIFTKATLFILSFLPLWLETLCIAILGSMFIAHNMLFSSVQEVLKEESLEKKREKLQMLVSRDTQDLDSSDINKALIETYAENLSDGVIAPLFFFVLFGFVGIVLYKAVNTLDSMVGYKNSRYKNYGFFSAKFDDLLNYIPARITTLLITTKTLQKIFIYGKKHESPNAGYPISAMAFRLNLSLGGDTKYFGKIKKKPLFGEGKKQISSVDVQKMLHLKEEIDLKIIGVLLVCSLFLWR